MSLATHSHTRALLSRGSSGRNWTELSGRRGGPSCSASRSGIKRKLQSGGPGLGLTVGTARVFVKLGPGRAIAQAVSRRLAEALGSRPGWSVWDLWWTEWYWDRLFSESFGFPCQYHSTAAIFSLIIWGMAQFHRDTISSHSNNNYWSKRQFILKLYFC
jgi:hypothetical protein